MRLTIIGSGDAFGSGGRFNTCFFLETAKGTLLVDCGASSLVALKARGVETNAIDGILLSHLHGDHFGALPFLLLDAQFLTRRERPLLIVTPRLSVVVPWPPLPSIGGGDDGAGSPARAHSGPRHHDRRDA